MRGQPATRTWPGRVWLGTVRQWHWVSSAACLIGMLLFAVTGITLNHAGQIEAEPEVTSIEAQLPQTLLQALAQDRADFSNPETPVPESVRRWLADEHRLRIPDRPGEWMDDEVYVSLPRPGGDAWLSVDLASGAVLYEKTTRGWIAYLNDLHKGRNTGGAWSWFIDVFAVVCVVFCLTGLILLQRHAAGRPTTWPLVALGLVVPLLLAVLFIH